MIIRGDDRRDISGATPAVPAYATLSSTGRQAAFAATAGAEDSTTHCEQQATFTHEHCAAWRTDY
ncbi:hypothetical protein [Granulicella arctica]|uniref:hypothetical protein n=1 Tax=Granulicella arctica TaxID=940613 RepID=UPI0021E0847D|nr:hypothetical protein [Granulicella arctica]